MSLKTLIQINDCNHRKTNRGTSASKHPQCFAVLFCCTNTQQQRQEGDAREPKEPYASVPFDYRVISVLITELLGSFSACRVPNLGANEVLTEKIRRRV